MGKLDQIFSYGIYLRLLSLIIMRSPSNVKDFEWDFWGVVCV